MSKTIKNNLFRFVTLRNPQLIDKKEDKPGFVFHPDEISGNFFPVISGASQEDKQGLLKQAGETFTPSALKTRSEARDINEKLYLFSSWLMRNKNALTFSEIKENALDIDVLESPSELLSIWDNLIYQTIEKKSTYVREAMIQLLIANQFLNAFNKFSENLSDDIIFTEDQEKEFIRRANASVVMSNALFSKAKVTNPGKKVSAFALKQLENTSDIAIAKYQKTNYNALIEELKTVEVKYNKDSQKAYALALDNHNIVVEKLIKDAKPVETQETDPETGETTTVTTYPDLVLPKFDFKKAEAITDTYLNKVLSNNSLLLFNNESLDVYDTFEEVYQVLKSKIKANNQSIISKTPKSSKQVKIGGVIARVNSGSPVLDYNIPNLMEINPNGPSPFMVFYNVVEPVQIASMTYTIDFLDGTTDTNSSFIIMPSSTDMIKLFPNGTPYAFGAETYTISGEITLQSGEKYSFSQVVDRKSRFNMGTFEAVNDATQTVDKNHIYGVTSLGIADFRRVEQEVCCYVPGEVSHIENVMAREYKERSTRSLISSEITNEVSEERERENLTDTTMTERNEMQTEVSSVLNEDQSQAQGASANMSYNGKVSFNAGAHFNSSSSSSTSNSNSQAQTYAQEVTERAMERIVTKTQTKRTSRILKEFEENNKHGFDNTKGSEHVTGVYRWVDKIYKNTLINYGKRLMYEFAIPEPARFLKDALWKKIENNEELESAVVLPELPTHPSMLVNGVVNATQLDETNYQAIASLYNANVEAPPLKHQVIGWEHAFSLTNDEGTARSSSTSLDIPKGYFTIECGFAQTGLRFPSYGSWGISIGGEYRVGSSNTEKETQIPIDTFVEKLPISVYTDNYWGGTININVKLERLPEHLQQWQNETYNAIIDAYNEQLREYNEAMTANEVLPTDDKYKLTFNPLHNRSLEKKELKRISIELLIDQIKVSKDNYNGSTIAKVNKNQAFSDHAATVKFFEQAFDWEIMAYMFYPYFYGKEADWKDLFQAQDAADPLFQGFLQSGMARTVVPVRPGFEDAVNWYMATGEIWNGQGLIVDQDDDLYVSVAEEMQTIEGEVEGSWETRLPTNLTVLQAGSIGLKAEGLPCNTDCNDFRLFDSDGKEILDNDGQSFKNPIEQTNTLIGGEAVPETTTA